MLTPLRTSRAGAVHSRLARLRVTEDDVIDAGAWAGPRRRVGGAKAAVRCLRLEQRSGLSWPRYDASLAAAFKATAEPFLKGTVNVSAALGAYTFAD